MNDNIGFGNINNTDFLFDNNESSTNLNNKVYSCLNCGVKVLTNNNISTCPICSGNMSSITDDVKAIDGYIPFTKNIDEVIKIYNNGGLLEDYAFNPVDMEMNFYAGLFYYTVEEYNDMEDNDEFEKLFSAGIHKELLEKVENAQLAYDLMWKSAKEVSNSIGMVLNKIKGFLDNLPEQEDLNKLMDKLPKEWETVKNEYDNIIGKRLANNEVEGDKE